MELHKAVNRNKVKEFITDREVILLIESIESNEVEVLLAIEYNHINDLQDLLPKEFFENHGISGEANGKHFYACINNILEWMDLSVEDFIDQLAEQDKERYMKWKHNRNALSA